MKNFSTKSLASTVDIYYYTNSTSVPRRGDVALVMARRDGRLLRTVQDRHFPFLSAYLTQEQLDAQEGLTGEPGIAMAILFPSSEDKITGERLDFAITRLGPLYVSAYLERTAGNDNLPIELRVRACEASMDTAYVTPCADYLAKNPLATNIHPLTFDIWAERKRLGGMS
ncbi:MAG: hypothetical protein HY820_24055 [Acidobacteria bacterium]|nr:hypothetical protein [Acidobacteriota bacterium]